MVSGKWLAWHNITTICFARQGVSGKQLFPLGLAQISHKLWWGVPAMPVSFSAVQHMPLYLCEKKREMWQVCCYTSWQSGMSWRREKDYIVLRNKFRSIYEQISLVNMTGKQQSVNICFYLLITLPDKFMAVDCWHIHMNIYFPQLTGCSLVLWSTPFVNVKLESRRQLN